MEAVRVPGTQRTVPKGRGLALPPLPPPLRPRQPGRQGLPAGRPFSSPIASATVRTEPRPRLTRSARPEPLPASATPGRLHMHPFWQTRGTPPPPPRSPPRAPQTNSSRWESTPQTSSLTALEVVAQITCPKTADFLKSEKFLSKIEKKNHGKIPQKITGEAKFANFAKSKNTRKNTKKHLCSPLRKRAVMSLTNGGQKYANLMGPDKQCKAPTKWPAAPFISHLSLPARARHPPPPE